METVIEHIFVRPNWVDLPHILNSHWNTIWKWRRQIQLIVDFADGEIHTNTNILPNNKENMHRECYCIEMSEQKFKQWHKAIAFRTMHKGIVNAFNDIVANKRTECRPNCCEWYERWAKLNTFDDFTDTRTKWMHIYNIVRGLLLKKVNFCSENGSNDLPWTHSFRSKRKPIDAKTNARTST